MSAAEILSEYGVRVRYPMEVSDEPDKEAAKEAIGRGRTDRRLGPEK